MEWYEGIFEIVKEFFKGLLQYWWIIAIVGVVAIISLIFKAKR